MDFETTLNLGRVPFKICGWYTPYTPATREEAGEPEDCDLYDISLADEGLSQTQENLIMEKYGYKEFCDWLMEEGHRIYEDRKTQKRIDKTI